MIFKYGKAFASSPDEIGCVNPKIVAPMGQLQATVDQYGLSQSTVFRV